MKTSLIAMLMLIALQAGHAQEKIVPIRAGIIGIDAHALSWTKILNSPEAEGELAEMKIVAAYPVFSPDIPQSVQLNEKALEPMKALGVEMVDSIEALIGKVDAVMILSIDGRPHLEQAIPVIEAGKTVYIDKPIAASLIDAIRIFRLAKERGVGCFTSSSLRFTELAQNARAGNDPKLGEVTGCDVFSPCPLEPNHPDFFWYGIHGVEPLFTIMGTGCKTVTRLHTEGTDVTVGTWEDGRVASLRGIRQGQRGYGARVFGTKGIVEGGGFEGYEPLIVEIVKFFKTGKAPVSEAETLEIFAFMEAADESKRQGGRAVALEAMMAKALKAVDAK